ncbi:DUF2953 domain-containing protein [Paenibacillus dakarensis]|uniref:DUF2953 domain-containing protein n=1 Tax=Paenibacillus dakarensis TaxID=1527293 RepID=UPI001FDF44E8|nr:DUF2953 domain-containing protein [Paenibacillus dakarensis]
MWIFLWLLALVIFVFLLIIVMASTITMRMHLVLRGTEYKLNVEGKMLFGLVNVKYEFPFNVIDTGIRLVRMLLTSEKSEESYEDSEENPVNKRALQFSDMKLLFRATNGLKEWMINTMSIMEMSKSRWETSIALDNAAETAAAAGMVWGVKHTIFGMLSFYLRLTDIPQLQVRPDFTGPPQLSSDMSFEIQMNFGRALYAGLILMVRILRSKGGLKTWRKVMFRVQ